LSQGIGSRDVAQTLHLARSIPIWWSIQWFSTNEGVLNFFCEQPLEVQNLSGLWVLNTHL